MTGNYSFIFDTNSAEELQLLKAIVIEVVKEINTWWADNAVLEGNCIFMDDSLKMEFGDSMEPYVLEICKKCIANFPHIAFKGNACSGNECTGYEDDSWVEYDNVKKQLKIYSVYGENLCCPECYADLINKDTNMNISCGEYEPGEKYHCEECGEDVDPRECFTYVLKDGDLVVVTED